jgi:hypothetical protein
VTWVKLPLPDPLRRKVSGAPRWRSNMVVFALRERGEAEPVDAHNIIDRIQDRECSIPLQYPGPAADVIVEGLNNPKPRREAKRPS